MNHIYRLKRSGRSQQLQPVPETARAAGKGTRTGKTMAQAVASAVASVLLGGMVSLSHAQQAPPPSATQLPQGGVVSRGSASIASSTSGGTALMSVNQSSQRAVIDWASFNVGSQAKVQFNQPNSSAVVLNNILGNNASQIYGQISANGQVFLSNPSGVYFSPTAQVNVGGLVATTGKANADEFMAGNVIFNREGSTGSVVNEGQLRAALGGYIALLAPEVRNQGVVVAQAGTVALASGEAITLNFSQNALGLAGITTTPQTIASLIDNRSAVRAEGGQIILSAHALATLQGSVINNSGQLNATSLTEKGGKIVLMADTIELAGTSQIEANGPTGGGTVLVGGDWQGQGDVRQAIRVTMAQGASIEANATSQGDGGTVVLWSDVHHPQGFTQVSGSIKAEGGPQGGDGGHIETSGHQLLVGDLQVSARAPKGNFGEWLLDPYDITISSAPNSNVSSSMSTFTATGDNSVVNVTALQNAFLSSNITISTGSSGTQTGNLNLATDLTWANSATLTLSLAGGFTGTGNIHMSGAGTLSINQAGNSTYSGAISGASGKLTKSGTGTLTLTGNNSYGGLTTLSGGNLNLGSANAIGTTGAISFLGGTLQYSAANTTDYVGRFNANQTYRIDTNDQNVTLAAVLSGTSGLTKLGSGTLTLTGVNTYTGLTTISAGTLALSDAGSVSASSSVANSGVFDISATTSGASVKYITGSGATVLGSKTLTLTNVSTGQSYAGVISGTGGLVLPGAGSFSLTGNNTYTGSTTIPSGGTLMLGAAGATGSLAGPISVGGTFTINRTGALTLNGALSGAGTFNFSNGTLTLAGDNTFSGTLNWSSAGNLTLSGAGAWPAITVTSTKTLFVSGQGTLPNTVVTLSGSTTTLDISGATSGVTLKGLSANTFPAGKVVLGSNTLTLAMPDGASSSLSYGGVISGTGGLAVVNTTGSGMATLNFTASSSYTGLTTIGANTTLALGTDGSIGSSSGLNLAGTFTASKQAAYGGTNLKNLTGTGTVSISTGSLYISNPSGEFSGQFITSVPISLAAGRLRLSGDNTQFTSALTASGTTLELGHAGALGPATTLSSLTLQSGATLDLRGYTPLAMRPITISSGGGTLSNSATGIAAYNANINNNTGSSVITVDAPANSTLILNGTLSGGGNLTKGLGLGTVVVSAANLSRTGTTTVNGGTLQVGALDSTSGGLGTGTVTTSANLVFYRSGALSLFGMAGAISGTGHVTAQATGAVNVDRTITLTGANSTVRLIAGSASAANTSLISDLTLTAMVTTSSTGTLLLFAGSPTATVANGSTTNLSSKLVGATGAVRYKTYNADLNSLSSVVAGTRNFYYRLRPTLTVTGASVTANKTYDGTTIAFNAVVSGGTLSGAVDGDSMGFIPVGATYDTANAGSNKGMSFSLRGVSNSASWSVSGYATTATGTTSSGTITRAPLVIQANDDARFVTLTDTPGYAGVSYSGLVNQETSAVLGGSLTIARSSPGANQAGQYTLTPSGLTAANYDITYRTGTYTIIPANQLLIRVADASTVYGNALAYNISSARYLMPDGSIIDLTSQLSSTGGTYTLNDGASGSAQFGLALNNPTLSTAGLARVGVWNMAASGAVTTSPNFSNTLTVVGTQTITPRPLVVTATAAGKVYDGSTAATGVTLSDNRVSGDALTTGYTSAAFAGKDAASGVGVTVSGITASGADAGNYQAPNTSTTTSATITPKPLNLSGLIASAKTYDGSTSATLSSYGTLTGVLGVDDVQVDSWSALASFDSKNVGTAKTVTITGLGLGGANMGNYSLANPFTTTANITAKALTVSGTTVANKTYDGTTAATLTGGNLVGVVSADTANVLLTQAGSFANKNAENGKTVTAANTITGSEAGNYTLTQPTGLSANITPKTLTVKANNDANFFAIPDSTTVFNGVSYSGFVVGESSADLAFANGVGPTVSSSLSAGQRTTAGTYAGVLTPSGITPGNYTPVYQAGDFTVVPADKLLIRVPNSSAIYGTASSIATPTASYYSSLYSTEVNTLTVTPNAGAFDIVDTVNGGSVTVQLAPNTLPAQRSASGNAGVGSYNLTATGVSNLVGTNFSNTVEVLGVQTVTPKALTISASATAKTYDGTYTANVALASADAVNGDALQYNSSSALFANKNVKVGETVSVQGLSLAGADAGNYILQNASAATTADITAKALTVTGTTVANKTYDGTLTATLSNGSLVGVVSADLANVGLTQSGTFADKNIGTAKAVTSTSTLGGSEAGNYTLTQPTGLSADITARALTVTGTTVASKTYDGTLTATLSNGSLVGVVSADLANVGLTQSGTFADKNIGTAKAVTSTSTLGGSEAGNYTLTQPTGLSADITARALTVSGITATNKVYDGTTAATVSMAGAIKGGLISGDEVTVAASGTFADASAGNGKTVNLSASYGGTDVANYAITGQPTATANITPAPLRVTANDASKNFDGQAYSGGNGVRYSGLVNNETPSVLGGTLAYSGSSQGASREGRYAIAPYGLSSNNYNISYEDGELSIGPSLTSASPVPLVVPAVLASSAIGGSGAGAQTALSADAPSYPWPPGKTMDIPKALDAGLLAITYLHGNEVSPSAAAVAFEQNSDTISVRTAAAPLQRPAQDKVVFSSRLTEFMVTQADGKLVEFMGGMVNRRLVIVAPSSESKQLARSETNLVLAAAIMALGRTMPIMLAQLDGVVIDLR